MGRLCGIAFHLVFFRVVLYSFVPYLVYFFSLFLFVKIVISRIRKFAKYARVFAYI